MILRRVYLVKASGQLLVSIPRDGGIKEGDYVRIEKVNGDKKAEVA
jgi:hypothetical protein